MWDGRLERSDSFAQGNVGGEPTKTSCELGVVHAPPQPSEPWPKVRDAGVQSVPLGMGARGNFCLSRRAHAAVPLHACCKRR